MDAEQIKRFIDAMAASDLGELEVTHEGWTLRLARSGAARAAPAPRVDVPAPPAPAAVQASADVEVQAPMFGVVHLRPAPGAEPFVKVGDVIQPGQMLCSIEAMKVFNEVRAESGGRVARWLVEPGVEVESGQPLLVIEQVKDV